MNEGALWRCVTKRTFWLTSRHAQCENKCSSIDRHMQATEGLLINPGLFPSKDTLCIKMAYVFVFHVTNRAYFFNF